MSPTHACDVPVTNTHTHTHTHTHRTASGPSAAELEEGVSAAAAILDPRRPGDEVGRLFSRLIVQRAKAIDEFVGFLPTA